MDSKLLDLSDRIQWDSLLRALPKAQQDVYFSPAYYSIFEKNGEGKAHCYVFEKDSHLALYPFLVNDIKELKLLDIESSWYDIQGAYGYNGVVSSSNEQEFIKAFHEDFNAFCSENNIIAEFVRFHPLLENHRFSISNLEVLQNRKTVFLDLKMGYDEIWKYAYSSKNRNMIRKAQKASLFVKFGDVDSDLLKFRDLYIETMSRAGAEHYYYFDKVFFQNLSRNLKHELRILHVYLNSTIICTILLMICGDYAHYFLSARDSNYSHLPANNLALDFAVKHSIEQGCGYFHFGGGNNLGEKDYLFKFKASFSKTTSDFFIGKKIHNIEIYSSLCDAWENIYPEKRHKYNNHFLRYRF